MGTTVRSNLIIPEILQDAIRTALPGVKALFGTPAVVINFSLPNEKRGGDLVKVPYFGTLGEMQDVAGEGDALTPQTLAMSQETAAVIHSGLAFETSKWAEIAAAYADPYAEAARLVIESAKRRWDFALITAAGLSLPTTPAASNMVADSSSGTSSVTGAACSKTLDYDNIINAKQLWHDEQEDIELMVVHSKVYGDLLKLKDNMGRPLVTDPVNGGLQKFANIPLAVSDRMTVSSDATPKYTSLIAKRGALVLWANGTMNIEVDRDILADTNVAALHSYFVAYRYKNLPQKVRGGIVQLVTL